MFAKTNWVSVGVILALAVGIASTTASAQTFNRTFSVSSESTDLEIINQVGSIRIQPGNVPGRIVVSARQSDGDTRIDATQSGKGKVKVAVSGRGTVDLEIVAPAATNLDLLCFKCTVLVSNTTGPVHARTTDGQILLTEVRSPRVEAHSTKGNVTFKGEILPNGNYTLKSFAGRVDATLPANAEFKLSAASFRGGIDLGGFPVSFERQTSQVIEGVCGAGRATLSLWTQDGGIQLHRKP